jgi:hypothetical protein
MNTHHLKFEHVQASGAVEADSVMGGDQDARGVHDASCDSCPVDGAEGGDDLRWHAC